MTMPKGWNNSNNNANTNNNNLPLSRKQKKPLDKKASLEAHLTMQEDRYRKKNKKHKDKYHLNNKKHGRPPPPPSSSSSSPSPQLLPGEQVFWSRALTKGFFRKKSLRYK